VQAIPRLDAQAKCFCRIAVKNNSSTGTAKNVKVEIVSINPDPKTRTYGFVIGDLPYPIRLRPSEAEGNMIHPLCISKFDVFVVDRATTTHDKKQVAFAIIVSFAGRPVADLSEEGNRASQFNLSSFKPEHKQYKVKLRASAEGTPPVERVFLVSFTLDLSEDAVRISTEDHCAI